MASLLILQPRYNGSCILTQTKAQSVTSLLKTPVYYCHPVNMAICLWPVDDQITGVPLYMCYVFRQSWLSQPLHPYLLLPPPAELLDPWFSFTQSSMRTNGNTKPEDAIGEKHWYSEYALLLVIVLWNPFNIYTSLTGTNFFKFQLELWH